MVAVVSLRCGTSLSRFDFCHTGVPVRPQELVRGDCTPYKKVQGYLVMKPMILLLGLRTSAAALKRFQTARIHTSAAAMELASKRPQTCIIVYNMVYHRVFTMPRPLTTKERGQERTRVLRHAALPRTSSAPHHCTHPVLKTSLCSSACKTWQVLHDVLPHKADVVIQTVCDVQDIGECVQCIASCVCLLLILGPLLISTLRSRLCSSSSSEVCCKSESALYHTSTF